MGDEAGPLRTTSIYCAITDTLSTIITKPILTLYMCKSCDHFDCIKSIIADLEYTHVISASAHFCVVIAPSAQLALIAADVLLEQGYINKTIRGHFIDCYYVIVHYG